MQNIDFYSGKTVRETQPNFNRENPEFFSRFADVHSKDEDKSMKKATRMLFLIVALCIISFTTGLVIGIKYASAPDREIVDEDTRKAVGNIGKKVANIIKEGTATDLNAAPLNRSSFPRDEFPYAIKVQGEFSQSKSREIATQLSGRGQTVILARNNDKYRIFLGPYRNIDEAESNLRHIKGISRDGYMSNVVIIKR